MTYCAVSKNSSDGTCSKGFPKCLELYAQLLMIEVFLSKGEEVPLKVVMCAKS